MTPREQLLKQLQEYSQRFPQESKTVGGFRDFISENSDCYQRSNAAGHITASAFITNALRSKLVLLHHVKLDRWLQPGGHADGECNLVHVALKEAKEETGVSDLTLCQESIFDVDIHLIPRRGEVLEHYHYDVRYLFEAADSAFLKRNHESQDVRWIALDEIEAYTEEESVLRMAKKMTEGSL